MQASPLRTSLSQQLQLELALLQLSEVLPVCFWTLALMAKLLCVFLAVGCQVQRVRSAHG